MSIFIRAEPEYSYSLFKCNFKLENGANSLELYLLVLFIEFSVKLLRCYIGTPRDWPCIVRRANFGSAWPCLRL